MVQILVFSQIHFQIGSHLNFVCSTKEYCSPLGASTPASHLWNLKASKILVTPTWGQSTRSVICFHIAGRSVIFYRLSTILALSSLSAANPFSVNAGGMCSSRNFLLVKLPKFRLTAHFNASVPHFARPWNHLPEDDLSHCSLQGFKQALHYHVMSSLISLPRIFPIFT